MTEELVAWLREQVDADERVARACIDEVGPEREGEPFTDGSGLADRDSFPAYPWGSQAAELEFMAGPGHPARVLAEVAAKRRIIERCVKEWDEPTSGGAVAYVVLHQLASVYAGRPGWRSEWALDEEETT